jgi:outer membrane translocation and assembly module TamA
MNGYEQRLFTDWSLFRLFNVGLVAFLDSGKSWYKANQTFENHGWLTDVGVGLRLVPDKTDIEHVIHLDVGYPLKKRPGAEGTQFKIEVKKTL